MRFCEFLPKLEVLTEVSKFANQFDNEVDYNLPITQVVSTTQSTKYKT